MNKHGELFEWDSIDEHSSAVLTENNPTGKVIDISTEPDYKVESPINQTLSM